MPFDPISAGLMVGGKVLDLFKEAGAANRARQAEAYQREDLARALASTGAARTHAMNLAGGLRQDRFGNATYYDPRQGRWITYYTPEQQALIEGGQERQRRAQVRGAQASQDYDTLRGEYLYRRPKTEAESYDEIVRLINQATGQGERALNTLTNRWGTRTRGNLVTLDQMDTGPSPAQQLAETMLQARKTALEEYGTREKLHQSRYLPALKQFEDTANYVAPLDPTGSEIQGMTSEGLNNMLKYGSEYDKLLGTMAIQGSRGGGGGGAAAGRGTGFGDLFNNLAKMLAPEKAAAGTLGGTKGARVSTSGGDTPEIGDWDRRFNFYMGPSERGSGGEPPGTSSVYGSSGYGGRSGVFGAGAGREGGAGSVTDLGFGSGTYYTRAPDYGDIWSGSGSTSPWGSYATPWSI